METKSWALMDMLKRAWSLTKENLIVMWGLLFLVWLVSFLVGLIGGADITSVTYWIFWLVQMVMTAWLSGSMYKILLNIVAGEEASFSVFKEMKPYIGKLFLLSIANTLILYSPLILVGLVQCLFLPSYVVDYAFAFRSYGSFFEGAWIFLWLVAFVVMIYLTIRLLFSYYALVDQPEKDIKWALRYSWEITKGNEKNLILAFLLVVAINFVGLLALGIGIAVSIVTSLFMLTLLYRKMGKSPKRVRPLKRLKETSEAADDSDVTDEA